MHRKPSPKHFLIPFTLLAICLTIIIVGLTQIVSAPRATAERSQASHITFESNSMNIERDTAYIKEQTLLRESVKTVSATWPQTYIVQPGDYLAKIAGSFYNNENDWPFIYQANNLNSTVIYPDQKLTIPDPIGPIPDVTPPTPSPVAAAADPTSSSGGSGIYSAAELGALWVSVGGSPSEEGVAECIAEHESGGNPNAISPTNDYGLWQIHDDPAALNPIINAETAVSMSDNGTNWSPWTTAPDCGV
jgi:LysM repeat protein